ncbi:Isy1-like splicing factor [Lipomyces oligophaga]|uniref:Isy1-like splicing factor n=1 Tax=Lipomyces oligophaga TaxID=45792 RepID=UPI0034CEE283
MSRNSEKAQSMLYRFREQEAAEMGIMDLGRQRRPRVVSTVDSVVQCEKWRNQLVREISRKVSKIQDESLSNYEIRDLNDEINKMMREKYAWEARIRELGGPNYSRAVRMFDDEGRELPSTRGYKYFGRARELPGVKELLMPIKPDDSTQNQINSYNTDLNADYYGYRDEEDQNLLLHEEAVEKNRTQSLHRNSTDPPEDWVSIERPTSIPNRNQVETWLLERRKQRIMDRYNLTAES